MITYVLYLPSRSTLIFLNCNMNVYERLFYFSKFLYDLTRDDGTNPSRSVVQRWLKSIETKIGVVMQWTQRIHGALVNRANFLKRQQRILKGGAPRARFFQNEWKLNVQVGEIVM